MASALPSIEITRGASRFEAYRNIATCDPAQSLYDDLVDEDEFHVLEYIDNKTSGIDHTQPQWKRVEQYGHIEDSMLCFDEKFWRWGQFGDGSFGVWYGALEEETSIQETLYHRPEMDQNDFLNTRDPIIQARRMFKADLSPQSYVNFCSIKENHPLLVHPSDYEFCQSLGRSLREQKVDMALSPSVRNTSGVCVPVFNSQIIVDRPIRTYFFIYPLDGSQPIVAQRQF